jgi:hypothetical protein
MPPPDISSSGGILHYWTADESCASTEYSRPDQSRFCASTVKGTRQMKRTALS